MSDKKPQYAGIIFGVLALSTFTLITIVCFIPILFIGILKLVPNQSWRVQCTKAVDQCANLWVGLVVAYIHQFYPTRWHITGATEFNPKQWYLVIANHQSWLDTIILQSLFYKKIPVLKFFVKEELKWIPLLGFSWWAMGCPFMKRYSKEYIEKNPHKKGKDLLSTQKALNLFKSYPSSIISFVEGTRFTPQKKLHQQSPYTSLLKPKAGGISQVISTMGQQLQSMIDVTIVYENPQQSFWDFLCRRMELIHVNIRTLNVPATFTSSPDILEDSYTQSAFRAWLNDQWATKDALITVMKNQPELLY